MLFNSLGVKIMNSCFDFVGVNGRLITFGVLTDVKLNIKSLYSKQIKLIGSTGSTRKQFQGLIDFLKDLKIKVWNKFKIDNTNEALEALFAKERNGRILIEV
jgi:D-arabinose 1-dehydrogenase-like Zn-dependent alcohol dehydrogenase